MISESLPLLELRQRRNNDTTAVKTSKAGLYIHIPFCQKKCHYCDFYSIAATRRIGDFIAALKQEMELYRDWWPKYDTLYLGGGTPSLLSIEQLADIIKNIQKIFHFTVGSEWTIEVNPDDLSLSYLKDLHSLGFNRLSLGLQSMNDDELRWLGRRHTAAQGLKAIEKVRQAGFNNLSIDLIYALPYSSQNLWFQQLKQVLEYTPEHLSCYQLSYEPHTKITLQQRRGLIKPVAEQEEAGYFLNTSQVLESAGYLHYEVSNFSRGKQRACQHNQKYWQHIPYLGLGPSAHSFAPHQKFSRHWNHRSLSLYYSNLSQRLLPIAGKEILVPRELRLEALYLGLRTRRGIQLENFQRQYGQNLLSTPPGLASRLISENRLELRKNWLCPTPLGLAVADALALLW